MNAAFILSYALLAPASFVQDAAVEFGSSDRVVSSESDEASSNTESDFNVRGVDVVCESWNYSYRGCPVGFHIDRAYLVEQYSRTACTEGITWGYGETHIWVDHGCRGRFHVESER